MPMHAVEITFASLQLHAAGLGSRRWSAMPASNAYTPVPSSFGDYPDCWWRGQLQHPIQDACNAHMDTRLAGSIMN